MAFNPMQQQQSPDMLMAMMTDPRATPQQRMAAMSALNTMKGGANAPQQPPQMTGDGTGVSDMDPAFMAAVRQEMMGQGPEEQPEIAQPQAAPEAPQNPSTEALMSGAADASRVAAMAHGGAVKGYENGTDGNDPSSYQADLPPDPTELLRIATTAIDPITRFRAKSALRAMSGQVAPSEAATPPEAVPMRPPQARMQKFAIQAPSMPDVNIEQPKPDPAAGQEKPARPAGRDYYALLEKMAEEGGSEATSSKDKYMALLQAGLGTMAAASQPGAKFLGSIGQGGLMGVEGLEKLKAARAQDRMKKMTLYGTLAGRQEASEDRAAALAQAVTEAEKNRAAIKEQRDLDRASRESIASDSIALRTQLGEEASSRAKSESEQRDEQKYTAAAINRTNKWAASGVWTPITGDKEHDVEGPPTPGEEQDVAQVDDTRLPLKNRKDLIFAKPDTELKTKTSVKTMTDLSKQARELINHPGLSAAVGFGGTTYSKIPGTDAANFAQKLDTLKSKTFLGTLSALRNSSKTGGGVGNVSNREGDRLSSAIAPLGQEQSKEQLIQSLKDIAEYADDGAFNMQNAFIKTYGVDKSAAKSPVPTPGTALKPGNYKYDLKTGEMIPE